MRKPLVQVLALVALAGCGGDRETEAGQRPAAQVPDPEPRPTPAADASSPDVEGATADDGVEAVDGGADSGPAAPALPTGKPLLLEFTRDHCLPCEIMAPWMKQLREQHEQRVQIVEINIDRPENKPLGRYFKARSIPTQVYVDRYGREVSRHVGIATKAQMERTMKRHGFLDDPADAGEPAARSEKARAGKRRPRK